jgi:hypothetical protein
LSSLRGGGLGLQPRHACNRSPPDLRPVAGWKKSLAALFSFLFSLMIAYRVFPLNAFIFKRLFVCALHVFSHHLLSLLPRFFSPPG